MLIKEVVDLFIQQRRTQLNVAPATARAYRYALYQLVDFMEDTRGRTSYQEISRLDIGAWNEFIKNELDAGRWSKSRYLLIVKTLKVFFRWIEEDEDCKEEELKSWRTKMPRGGKTPRREYIPSPDELRGWQKSFNTKTMTGLRDYLIFHTLLETGMRRGELATLKVEHVMLGTGTMYVSGKTGPRTIQVSSLLSDLIKTYLKKREKSKVLAGSPYMFPSKRNLVQPANAQYITKIFCRCRKKTGLAKITPHTLRHAFATYYLINGGGTEGLRMNTGHKTYDAMMHYTHLAKVQGTHQKEEMEKASPMRMLRRR